MSQRSEPPSALATIQAPTIEVRDQAGELIGSVERSQGVMLISRGWADVIGRRAVKYLRLRADAPWRPAARSWRGGSATTQPVRADQTCKNLADHQAMGDPRTLREHKPLV